MDKKNYVIAGVFLISIIITSIVSIIHSEHDVHELMHILTLFTTVFLAFLSFRAFYNYRLGRLLLSAFAFLLFGVSEFIEVMEDVESHEGPFSINEIRDYFIIGAIALFAIGKIVRIKK